MNRLTRKIKGCFLIDLRTCKPMEYEQIEDSNACVDKLGELEDIEEEIGIELTTLFKALKYGVYYYTSQNQLTHDYVWLYDNYVSASVRDKLSYSLLTCFQKQILSFEDYGVTWSLYMENLEQ